MGLQWGGQDENNKSSTRARQQGAVGAERQYVTEDELDTIWTKVRASKRMETILQLWE